jgi:hypothetical protein
MLFMMRLDLLIGAADDPAALFDDTRALSIRHIKVPSPSPTQITCLC